MLEQHVQATQITPRAGQPSVEELPELMRLLNEATSRFQVSHDQLTGEVARLRAQLREADDQLQRSRRLAALGEMAAGIAHEIRNPLGSIGLYARMLAEDLGDRPDEREVATKIGRAVRGLDAIVTDVLAFAGDARMRVATCSAADLVELAIEQAGIGEPTRVLAKGVADIDLACDGGKLRQALVNVIRNAGEAIEQAVADGVAARREIVVGARRQVLGETDAVAFEIRDSGTGIHGEATERMFNPFYTTREVGTGLGLAIVHRIVDAHGGRVSVSNNGPMPGDGATVEVIIPARQGHASDRTRDTPTPHGRAAS